MKKDKVRIYVLELLLLFILFFALFVSNKLNYIVLALILVIYALIVRVNLKKKKILSIYKKQVLLLMMGFGLIYLGFFFMMGFIINDFVRQPVIFGFKTIYRFIIPLTLIIISSEVMRYRFLSQKAIVRLFKKEVDLSKYITFVNMVLIDLLIYIRVYDLTNYNDFLTTVGFVLFASISCNLFYNYVSRRYGMWGIVVYRMITILYSYIIPIMPNIYIYFRTFLRMLYPYILYMILEHTYSKTDFVVAYKDKKKSIIGITVLVILMVLITMLISCQFRYGILVIGSRSMTGAINKGDAVVFEKYDGELVKVGQVIIFKKNDLNMVHRVVDVKSTNGEVRYYTKGDFNKEMDSWYVTKEDIVGITKFRIVYIGYPTIWLHELFS